VVCNRPHRYLARIPTPSRTFRSDPDLIRLSRAAAVRAAQVGFFFNIIF
jgi:hypothetical protein